MLFHEFVTKVIDSGIRAAKEDYTRPADAERLEGSLAGFEACRGKDMGQLTGLLQEASRQAIEAHREEADNYWVIRSRQAEIEWVCNVVSSALASSGLAVIVPPTMGGMMTAARILNGDGCVILGEDVPL